MNSVYTSNPPIFIILVIILIIAIIGMIVFIILFATKKDKQRVPVLPLFNISIITDTSITVSWNINFPKLQGNDVITVYVTHNLPEINGGVVTNTDSIFGSSPALQNGMIGLTGLDPDVELYVTIIETGKDTNNYTSIFQQIYTDTDEYLNQNVIRIEPLGIKSCISFNTNSGILPVDAHLISSVTEIPGENCRFVYNKDGIYGNQLVSEVESDDPDNGEWVLWRNNEKLSVIKRSLIPLSEVQNTQWLYKNNFWYLQGTNTSYAVALNPNQLLTPISVITLPVTPDNIAINQVSNGQRWENLSV